MTFTDKDWEVLEMAVGQPSGSKSATASNSAKANKLPALKPLPKPPQPTQPLHNSSVHPQSTATFAMPNITHPSNSSSGSCGVASGSATDADKGSAGSGDGGGGGDDDGSSGKSRCGGSTSSGCGGYGDSSGSPDAFGKLWGETKPNRPPLVEPSGRSRHEAQPFAQPLRQ